MSDHVTARVDVLPVSSHATHWRTMTSCHEELRHQQSLTVTAGRIHSTVNNDVFSCDQRRAMSCHGWARNVKARDRQETETLASPAETFVGHETLK